MSTDARGNQPLPWLPAMQDSIIDRANRCPPLLRVPRRDTGCDSKKNGRGKRTRPFGMFSMARAALGRLQDLDRADLELRNAGNGVQGGMGQFVGRRLGEMEGDENGAVHGFARNAHARRDLAPP